MKTDLKIKKDVLEELEWQPNIDETQIGVIVENGTVMLSGVLDDYQKKVAAEEAVKRVKGVKALAGDIQVKYGANYQKTDKEIGKAIVEAFEWDVAVPEDKINIEVRDGWVNLSGEVDSSYQRYTAKKLVEKIIGVKWINNTITLKKSIYTVEIKEKIAKAFKRSADIDADGITVDVMKGLVKLKGIVNSISEKKAAEKAAYLSPGVHVIINELEVID
ncbi:BON domain-containing protein [Polaribacter sp. Hel1_85]|uniref:BON domain-containing protein n=1 Tax=Polaribacter sp. Hel1_85 TaxID=1250005 RepID=UPI00052B7FBE|nr:BON domain-containing protein [Polaribacter sp. Hel1_85]KGL64303.1 transport-associated protein [Polaribacter sp. Hel1_85]